MIPDFNTVHFETLGCKLNQIESEAAAKAFSDCGFSVDVASCTAASKANESVFLCIVNTCTVTAKAEQKARRLIRLLLEKYPHAAVLVTGCYAEVEPDEILAISSRIAVLKGTKKEYLSQIPAIIKASEIIAAGDSNDSDGHFSSKEAVPPVAPETPVAPEKIAMFLNNLVKEIPAEELRKASFSLATDTFLSHSRASIKIQDGCSSSCAYCRIHIARGKSVSLPASEVLHRVKSLEKAGQCEVVITGVNLSQYYSNEDGNVMRFPELMKFLLAETEKIAFRISSLYPDIVTESFCAVLDNKRIRPHFHLSVQSGSDNILKKMRRPYSAADVVKASKMLRQIKPDCFLAADIITGFPSETEDDFSLSMELCRECGFSWVHVFPFSARPGTEAFSMRPQVPQSVSGERARRLTSLAMEQKKLFLENTIGREFRAIIEKRRINEIRAVSENFIHIRILNDNRSDYVKLGGREITLRIVNILHVRAQTESVEAEAVIVE